MPPSRPRDRVRDLFDIFRGNVVGGFAADELRAEYEEIGVAPAPVRGLQCRHVERRVDQMIMTVEARDLAEPRSIFLKVCVAPSGPAFRVEQERPCEPIAIKLTQRVCS